MQLLNFRQATIGFSSFSKSSVFLNDSSFSVGFFFVETSYLGKIQTSPYNFYAFQT